MKRTFNALIVGVFAILMSIITVLFFQGDVLAKDEEFVIVLDPGHGGLDSGALKTHDEVQYVERDINMKIAEYCKEELEKQDNIKVYLTRYDNSTKPELTERAHYAATMGADILISLHNNAANNSEVRGAEIIVPNKNYHPEFNQEMKELAELILANLEDIGIAKRSIYTRDCTNGELYEDGSLADYYTVINESKKLHVPALIIEHAYLTNKADAISFLREEETLKKIGKADASAIIEYIDSKTDIEVSDDIEYIHNGINYGYVFNPEYYLSKYPDLKQAYGDDYMGAFNHFIDWGMREGRQASSEFEVYSYKGRYSDLQSAFGNDLVGYYNHYCVAGIYEGREAKEVETTYNVTFKREGNVISTQNIPFGHAAMAPEVGYSKAEVTYDKVFDCITQDMEINILNLYVVDGVDYSYVFDPEFYLEYYKDLENVYGNDYDKAFQHFIEWGMAEDRYAKEDFDIYSYKARYPDLKRAYGNKSELYYKHYCQYGYWEKRDASANDTQYTVVFYDGQIEISRQNVLYGRTAVAPKVENKGATVRWDTAFDCVVNDLTIHLVREYTYNGMDYADVFDAQYYLDRYPDLREAYGSDYANVFKHFIDYGMYEGRSAKDSFNVYLYKENYSDLQNAYGDNLKMYYHHYILYGKTEGRSAC